MTNPALNLALAILVYTLGPWIYWPALAALEVLVLPVEYLLLRAWLRPGPPHLAWLVVTMNAASLAAGFILLWL